MLSLSLLVVVALMGVTHGGSSFQEFNMFRDSRFCRELKPPMPKRYTAQNEPILTPPPADGNAQFELTVKQEKGQPITTGYEIGGTYVVELKGKTVANMFNDFFIYLDATTEQMLTAKLGDLKAVDAAAGQTVPYCIRSGVTSMKADTTDKNSVKVNWIPQNAATPTEPQQRTIGKVTFTAVVVTPTGVYSVSSGPVAATKQFETLQEYLTKKEAAFRAQVSQIDMNGMMQQFRAMMNQFGGQAGAGGGFPGLPMGNIFSGAMGGGGGGGLFGSLFGGNTAPTESQNNPQTGSQNNPQTGSQTNPTANSGGPLGGIMGQLAQQLGQAQSAGQSQQGGTGGNIPMFPFQMPPMPPMGNIGNIWNTGMPNNGR